jgi:hypothetical protein
MANYRDKTKEVFIELINLQLAPHNKTYNDVINNPEWYMQFSTTREKENEFISKGIEILRSKLKMSAKIAQQEMSWFILQWGLTTNETVDMLETETVEVKSTRIRKTGK